MNFKDKEAIYLQIADMISENITLRKWLPGEKIPSVRELATNLQVNPNTVARTYEYLQQQEIIFNKRGLGLFVADYAVAKIKTIRKDRFLKRELPDFFASLYLLDIDLAELIERYDEFKRNFKN
ncbi:MAG: GntR family transcriptional regulator [Mucilaginibacter sp.]|nr:GntR family transcriptional regulator [Mucilaginibacter sp.]